jgi:hypothetical protein
MASKPACVEGAANGLARATTFLFLSGLTTARVWCSAGRLKAEQTQEQRRVSPISCAPPAAHPPIRSSNYEPQ